MATRREFLVNSLAVGTISLVPHLDSVVLRGKPLMCDDLDNLLVHVATRAAAPDAGRPSS
jgi:hypothetical protein